MTARIGKPQRILVVEDTSEAQIALESALTLAEAHGASLEIIACVEPPHDLSLLAQLFGDEPSKLIDVAVKRTRDEVRAKLSEIAPDRAIELTVSVGKAYLEIIRHVARSGCDFVIKKAEPLSGIDRFLFASTDQHLLRKCPCPVWLQTPTAPRSPQRILAAVDLDIQNAAEPETLTALNQRVVDAACTLAAGPEAEVIVLHAWDAPAEGMIWAFSGENDAHLSADRYTREIHSAKHAAMGRFLAQMRNNDTPRLVSRLARGAPETVIHEEARAVGADVVVMGTVARTGLGGVFIGNTAENIINSLDCPVLAVKPEGFVSPLLHA